MTMTSIAQLIIGTTDLAAALLFLYGLKRMSSPVTAPSGIFGAGVAWWAGKKVAMTAMPQMVAIYNGLGGGAAGAIAAVELFGGKAPGTNQLVVTLLGALIGAISMSGPLIAWAKLQGVIKKPLRVKGQQVANAAVLIATLAIGGCVLFGTM